MLTGRYDGLTGAKRYEVYIILLMFIGGMAGSFFLGSYMTTQNTNVISQQIYDQGFAAGEARGMNKMQTQCDGEVASLARNCKEWYDTNLRFQNIDLTTYGSEINGRGDGMPGRI